MAAHAIDGEEGHNQEGAREVEETRVVGGGARSQKTVAEPKDDARD